MEQCNLISSPRPSSEHTALAAVIAVLTDGNSLSVFSEKHGKVYTVLIIDFDYSDSDFLAKLDYIFRVTYKARRHL